MTKIKNIIEINSPN